MRAKPFVTVILLAGGFWQACAKKENKNSELSSISQVVSSEAELPSCSGETVSQVYWVETEEKFMVCNGAKFVEVKGEKGDKGDTGTTGPTGPAGSPANSGVWLFDSDGQAIGVMVDSSRGLVLFPNGGMTRINLVTGAYNYPVALGTQGNLVDAPGEQVQCYFTEPACGGTCYQLKFGNVQKTLKGAVYKSGNSYYEATGAETLVQNIVIKSSDNTGTGACDDFADATVDGYPIAKLYSLPDGITLPLKTPISFGFKTEE